MRVPFVQDTQPGCVEKCEVRAWCDCHYPFWHHLHQFGRKIALFQPRFNPAAFQGRGSGSCVPYVTL